MSDKNMNKRKAVTSAVKGKDESGISSKPKRTILHFFNEEASCSDDSEEDLDDVEEVDDDDDEEEEPVIDDDDSEAAKGDGCAAILTKQAKKKPTTETTKQPGNNLLPINNFSLTITKTKDDVPQQLLTNIFKGFIEAYCIKGGIATEVGARLGNCHLQSVIQLHSLKTQAALTALSKILFTLFQN
jgi:hypothetical protein